MPTHIGRFRSSFARFLVIGDSLAACCPFHKLSPWPFGALNLAKGGALLGDIARQIDVVPQATPRWILADGGLNDLLGAGRSPGEIHRDFVTLLRRLDGRAPVIFTLMPHVSDPAAAPRIDAANALMRDVCRRYGVAVLDLNPQLSLYGARRPETTQDGLHFTDRANALWIAALRTMTR